MVIGYMFKKRLSLKFSPEIVDKPITYQLLKNYKIVFNIIQARISPEEEGHLIIDFKSLEEDDINKVIDYLQSEGVEVKILEKSIIYNEERCINCGACTGVCKSGALSMDSGTYKLIVDNDKCLFCEMCLSACFVQALSLENG